MIDSITHGHQAIVEGGEQGSKSGGWFWERQGRGLGSPLNDQLQSYLAILDLAISGTMVYRTIFSLFIFHFLTK